MGRPTLTLSHLFINMHFWVVKDANAKIIWLNHTIYVFFTVPMVNLYNSFNLK